MTKPNSCSACGGSTGGSGSSTGPCTCGCSSCGYAGNCGCKVLCNPDPECRLLWCQQADMCDKVNPYPNDCTLCNLNTRCNMFFIDQPGYAGRCILDEMTFGQVYHILGHNPSAKEHMLRITSDPCLVKIANSMALIVPPSDQDQQLMRQMNNSLPYYTLFKGNLFGDIRKA